MGSEMTRIPLLETERLGLFHLTLDDDEFILELLNDPAFVRFIGDRGVKSLADAKKYLEMGPLSSYQNFGFGLWLVRLKSSEDALGICGLVKRDALPNIDIGYAFLERFWGKGYASEAALAVRDYALLSLDIKRLVAVVDPENAGSIKVLEKIGLRFERLVRLNSDGIELKLFAIQR